MEGIMSDRICRLRKVANTVRGPRAKALRCAARSLQTADELLYGPEQTFRGVAEAQRAAIASLQTVNKLRPEDQQWIGELASELKKLLKIADIGLIAEDRVRSSRLIHGI